jgi:hypothetical protein
MSGIIDHNLDKSGVIGGAIRNGSTLQAYCVITADTPSASEFANSLNVSSISYDTTTIYINFINLVLDPVFIWSVYGWSTGSSYKVLYGGTQSGVQSQIFSGYRIQNSNGHQAVTTNGALNGSTIVIYGKPA